MSLTIRSLLGSLLMLLAPSPSDAVIMKLTPLKEIISTEDWIFVTIVERVEPDRPGVVLRFAENLKGKAPFERLAVNLTGDTEAKQGNHTQIFLQRLAPKQQVILFTHQRGKRYIAFGFTEGSWFQMHGLIDESTKTVRWAFQHGEPYLRRTFKGTSAELRQVILDGLAGKKEPPVPNEKEKPGFGEPTVPMPKTTEEKPPQSWGEKIFPILAIEKAPTPRQTGFSGSTTLFAVIPTAVLAGPIALLAALFPGLFARLAIALKRWRAFLVIASTTSTLAFVYFWLRGYLPGTPWFGPQAFLLLMTTITAIGTLWAGRRYRRMATEDAAITLPPSRTEVRSLLGVAAALTITFGCVAYFGEAALLLDAPWRELVLIGLGLWAGLLYIGWRKATTPAAVSSPQVSLSTETAALGAMTLVSLTLLLLTWPRSSQVQVEFATALGEASEPALPRLREVKILYRCNEPGGIAATPLVVDDTIYVGIAHEKANDFYGSIAAIDVKTGQERCPRFTNDDDLKPVFSGVTHAQGRLYVGEGFHQNQGCKLFLLNASNLQPLPGATAVETNSHTEGTPQLLGNQVVFAAGDDGVWSADATTGKKLWQYPPQSKTLHVDTPITIVGSRIYAGSGYRENAVFCLDETGREIWKTTVPYRCFSQPLVLGKRVYVGVGTGNLLMDLHSDPSIPDRVPEPDQPRGAVLCLDANTGQILWQVDMPRSVHASLAGDARSIYAACRDGFLYCLDRRDGKLRWKLPFGSPLVTAPVLAKSAHGLTTLAVYVTSMDGLIACLHPATGQVIWSRDLRETLRSDPELTHCQVEILSSPALVQKEEARSSVRHLYFGAKLTNRNNNNRLAVLFAVEDEFPYDAAEW